MRAFRRGIVLREIDRASLVNRAARAWRSGAACIPSGLFCSLLTCLASVGLNLLVDKSGAAIPASLYLRKLLIGYAAAATVVVTVFPLLPLLRRRRPGRRLHGPG
jgi:hypothetical protein